MAINFPSSPVDGDLYSAVGRTWQYDASASAWKSISESNVTTTGLGIPNHENISVDGSGNTVLSGNFTPDANITYDLGSASNRWRDLYLSGNSIELGSRTITSDNIPEVDLAIAPEVLEIQVSAPAAGQATTWLWTWEQSTLPYARRTITNSPEVSVPLYKQGTYTVNNYAAYDLFDQMTQTHSLYLKWIDGAGTQNVVSWAVDAVGNPISDSHPDINGGAATDVQRINVSVPSTITLPTLTAPTVGYTVTNNGTGAYTFSGSASGDNPNIGPFYRGGTYTININATGHPFYFTTDNGTNFSAGTYFGEYTSGVTGSRTDVGTITFVVPNDAPDTLYYQCGNHSAMRGAIVVKDLAVETNNNGNYVIYFQHTQEGHKTPVELRPIPSLVNQMCLVYDSSSNKFVPQDLATYVENTPSFENKIREVAGTAELVVEDGSAVVAKVNVYPDSTYLPLVNNNAGDQAFATDINKLFIWDGSAWQQAGSASTDELSEGSTNLYYTDARVDARLASGSVATLETSGNVVVGGDLTVNGTTTTINSTTLSVDDLNITLASGAASAAAANGAGITIDGANATLIYDADDDGMVFNKKLGIGTQAGMGPDTPLTIVEYSSPSSIVPQIKLAVNTGDNTGTVGSSIDFVGSGDMTAIGSRIIATRKASGAHMDLRFHTQRNQFAMAIDENQNVGIGTVSPLSRLAISDGVQASTGISGGGTFIEVARTSGGDAGLIIQKNTANWVMGVDNSDGNAAPLRFEYSPFGSQPLGLGSGTLGLAVASSGFVGIGTAVPSRTLHAYRNDGTGTVIKVENQGTDNSTIEFVDTNTTDTVSIGTVGNNLFLKSDQGDIILATIGNPGTASVTVKANTGNVGIGEANPNHMLHITKNDATLFDPDNIPTDGSGASILINNTNTANGPSYSGINMHAYGASANVTRGFVGIVNDENPVSGGWSGTHGHLSFGIRGSNFGNVIERATLDSDGNFTLKGQGSFNTEQVRHSVQPTLNLDFANTKELDSRITFYRESIATYFDDKGVIRYAKINEPRFDHDPVTGESKGLLIENPRENETYYSDHPIHWTYTGYGVLTGFGNYYKTPIEGLSVRSLKFNNYQGTQCRRGIYTQGAVSGRTYTWSMFVKNIYAGQNVQFYLSSANDPFGGLAGGSFDFTALNPDWSSSVYNNSNVINAGKQQLKDGWWRIWITGTATTTGGFNPVMVSGATTYVPEIAVCGMQVEEGDFITSYMPTDTRFDSRNSKATYHDKNGILQEASENMPRYGYMYNGRKWVETGLILETAGSTNYIPQGHGFKDAGWSVAQNTDIVDNAGVAPDGSYTASKFTPTPITSSHSTYKQITRNSNPHCFSVYIKSNGNPYGYIYVDTQGGHSGYLHVNLDTGEYQYDDSALTGTVAESYGLENVGNGWYRAWISMAHTNGNYYCHINAGESAFASLGNWTPNGTEGWLVWGPQLENSKDMSSFIYNKSGTTTRATESASNKDNNTRAVDRLTANGDNVTSWYNNEEGTVYTEDSVEPNDSYAMVWTLATSESLSDGYISQFQIGTGGTFNTDTRNTGDNFDAGSGTQSAAGVYTKRAVSLKDNNMRAAANGTMTATDSSGKLPEDVSVLYIGSRQDGYRYHGHMKKFVYYPVQLTDEELAALTENN